MSLTTISGEIQTQPLNDNFSYLGQIINDLGNNIKNNGAIGDGTTDDTTAIQNTINNASGGIIYVPPGTYKITSAISVPSNTTIQGSGISSIIKLNTGEISGFLLSGTVGSTIRDLKILAEVLGTTPYIGGVEMQTASSCLVENLTIIGMSWGGIYLNNSNNNIIRGNHFSSFLGAIQDSADVTVYRDSNYNIVSDNLCSAGNWHGILIQDPSGTTFPTGNQVINNIISAHKAYGIAIYTNQQINTQTLVKGNNIRDIDGALLAGTSGAGIYIQSAGGVVVDSNEIRNCCINTSNFGTLAPAGIGITNILSSNPAPVIITNNVITDMTKGPGILSNTSGAGIIIKGNAININNSGLATNGDCIKLIDSVRGIIANNHIKQGNANYWGINITSTTVGGMDSTKISGNHIYGSGFGIGFNKTGSGNYIRSIISDNYVDTTLESFFLDSATKSIVDGNIFNSGDTPLAVQNATYTKITNTTMLSSNGAKGPLFAGTNTGSVMDLSCTWSATMTNNAGSGTIVEQYGNTAPFGSGSWAVGDRVIQSVPVVGQPKAWRCTVAGNPGTWVSEGNL